MTSSDRIVAAFDDALLDRLSRQGDPEADVVVAAHMAASGQTDAGALVRDIGAALAFAPTNATGPDQGADGPLQRYLHSAPPLPDWVDPALCERAASVFLDNALGIGQSLFCASLPEAYASARGARVLTLTARLTRDPVRRISETAQMVYDVVTRDGLVPVAAVEQRGATGVGYADARRVRLMHAAVRWFILHDPSVEHRRGVPTSSSVESVESVWFDEWGMPLNQEDLLGTLMTFTVAVFEALERSGAALDDDEAEAYLHRWCIVGYLIGIDADLLPLDLATARSLTATIRRRQQQPSADGRELTAALIRPLRASLPVPPLRGAVPAVIRHLITPRIAGMIGIRATGWELIVDGPLRLVNAITNRWARREIHHNLIVRWLSRYMARHLVGVFLGANRGRGRPPFAIPEEMRPTIEGQIPNRWRLS